MGENWISNRKKIGHRLSSNIRDRRVWMWATQKANPNNHMCKCIVCIIYFDLHCNTVYKVQLIYLFNTWSKGKEKSGKKKKTLSRFLQVPSFQFEPVLSGSRASNLDHHVSLPLVYLILPFTKNGDLYWENEIVHGLP